MEEAKRRPLELQKNPDISEALKGEYLRYPNISNTLKGEQVAGETKQSLYFSKCGVGTSEYCRTKC